MAPPRIFFESLFFLWKKEVIKEAILTTYWKKNRLASPSSHCQLLVSPYFVWMFAYNRVYENLYTYIWHLTLSCYLKTFLCQYFSPWGMRTSSTSFFMITVNILEPVLRSKCFNRKKKKKKTNRLLNVENKLVDARGERGGGMGKIDKGNS